MKKLEVRFTKTPDESIVVGTLAQSERRIYFEYTPEWLELDLHLSPLHLPNQPGLVEHTGRSFGPLPGLFDDSLPDGWGLLLMDRCFHSHGLNPSAVSALDRLAWLGTDTMGALTYHPPADRETAPSVLDLSQLSKNAREILAGDAAEVLPQLARAGGSPGGARPKVLVGVSGDACISGEADLPPGYEHWMVKLSSGQDADDAGAVEYAYAQMAEAAGIEMPETRLFETKAGDRFFGVRRFDRDANRRFHMHTFGNLIQANFRIPSSDYVDLFRVVSHLTQDHRQSVRMLRRMVFNILAHNRDDHVKNHAFLLDDRTGEWKLTPAYDLVFAEGPGGEHTMTVAGQGRAPTRAHVDEICRRASLTGSEIDALISQVADAVAAWPPIARQVGVSRQTIDSIARRLGWPKG